MTKPAAPRVSGSGRGTEPPDVDSGGVEQNGVCRIREKCPDCLHCQMCNETRCRICRSGAHGGARPELGPCITHGEYLAWKNKRSALRRPSPKEEEQP